MSITDWPKEERPRERLIQQGAAALSDAELLAIFLRIGVKGKSAVDLARYCLAHFGSLRALFSAPLADFKQVHGLGEAKYAQLQAVFELSQRAVMEELKVAPIFNSPQKVRDYLCLVLGNSPVEVFIALYLDTQNRLITKEELFRGTLTHTAVYPREVVKQALAHNAASVVFAHNHPSGAAKPSASDIDLTQDLVNALRLIDIRVIDHFVVAGHDTFSFIENGLL
jgi:DNA repair protein RadC